MSCRLRSPFPTTDTMPDHGSRAMTELHSERSGSSALRMSGRYPTHSDAEKPESLQNAALTYTKECDVSNRAMASLAAATADSNWLFWDVSTCSGPRSSKMSCALEAASS